MGHLNSRVTGQIFVDSTGVLSSNKVIIGVHISNNIEHFIQSLISSEL